MVVHYGGRGPGHISRWPKAVGGGTPTPTPVDVTAGRDAAYDAGTAGDIFVNSTGNDANTGTSTGQAVATLAQGIVRAKALGGVRTIRVMGNGKYREQVALTGVAGASLANPWRIASYGTDKPVISGGLVVTGFAACTSGDQALVGTNYASIYKATVATSSIDHTSYHAMLLTEDDTPLDLVQKRFDMSDLFVLDDYQTFYQSGTDGTVSIGLTSARTVKTLDRGSTPNGTDAIGSTTVTAIVAINVGGTWNGTSFTGGTTYTPTTDYTLSGNNVSWAPGGAEPAAGVTYNIAFDKNTPGTVTHPSVLGGYTDTQLAATAVAMHVEPNLIGVVKAASASSGVVTLASNTFELDTTSGGQKYALLNTLKDLSAGRWGYKDNGDGTLTIYVWPNNTANLTGKIEIAARKVALQVTNCAFVKIDGLLFTQTTATNSTEGRALYLNTCDDVVVEQVEVFNVSHNSRGYGGVVIQQSARGRLSKATMRNLQSSVGYYFQGTGGGVSGGRSDRVRVERSTQTPAWFFGQKDCIWSYGYHLNCGKGAHANLGTLYAGCDNFVVFGYNAVNPSKGYFTWQAGSRFYIINSRFPIGPDGRGVYDQTLTVAPPTVPSDNYFLNNFTTHNPAYLPGSPSTYLGNTTHQLNFSSKNNVSPDMVLGGGSWIARKKNILTGGGATYDPSEISVANPLTTFYDPAAGDFATIPGSVLTTTSGESVATEITALETAFPDFNFRRDITGASWDPADPGVGPWGKVWPVKTDVAGPVLSNFTAGAASASVAIGIDVSEIGSSIYWVRLANGATTPSAAQIIAGQDASGAAAGQTGSVLMVSTTGTKALGSVTGATATYKICVVAQDRHGNVSNIVTGSATTAAFTPVWDAFDGVTWLKRGTAITGAQANSKTWVMAYSVKRSSGQLAVNTTGGILSTIPTNGNHVIDANSTGRLRAKHKPTASGTITFDKQTPSTGTAVADEEYLVIESYTSDPGGGAIGKMKFIKISDGTLPANQPTDYTGADAAMTFASTSTFDIFKAALGAERFMLWDNAYGAADDSAVQQLFVKSGGGLQDPNVAVASLGTPLISIYGANLATGTNTGSGGNWSRS